MLTFDPANCDLKQNYKLLTGIVVPRPIALVSTISRNGAVNLAPFSAFNLVGANPPAVLFCPALRVPGSSDSGLHPDLRKDTLRNVEETGEFWRAPRLGDDDLEGAHRPVREQMLQEPFAELRQHLGRRPVVWELQQALREVGALLAHMRLE